MKEKYIYIIIFIYCIISITNNKSAFIERFFGTILIIFWFLNFKSLGNIKINIFYYIILYIVGIFMVYLLSLIFNFNVVKITKSIFTFNLDLNDIIIIVYEELIWRGLIQVIFISMTNVYIGIFITALIFTLSHNLKYKLIIFELLIFSLMLGIITHVNKTFLMSIPIHIGRNNYIKYAISEYSKFLE